jgi:hypothetical protein
VSQTASDVDLALTLYTVHTHIQHTLLGMFSWQEVHIPQIRHKKDLIIAWIRLFEDELNGGLRPKRTVLQ